MEVHESLGTNILSIPQRPDTVPTRIEGLLTGVRRRISKRFHYDPPPVSEGQFMMQQDGLEMHNLAMRYVDPILNPPSAIGRWISDLVFPVPVRRGGRNGFETPNGFRHNEPDPPVPPVVTKTPFDVIPWAILGDVTEVATRVVEHPENYLPRVTAAVRDELERVTMNPFHQWMRRQGRIVWGAAKHNLINLGARIILSTAEIFPYVGRAITAATAHHEARPEMMKLQAAMLLPDTVEVLLVGGGGGVSGPVIPLFAIAFFETLDWIVNRSARKHDRAVNNKIIPGIAKFFKRGSTDSRIPAVAYAIHEAFKGNMKYFRRLWKVEAKQAKRLEKKDYKRREADVNALHDALSIYYSIIDPSVMLTPASPNVTVQQLKDERLQIIQKKRLFKKDRHGNTQWRKSKFRQILKDVRQLQHIYSVEQAEKNRKYDQKYRHVRRIRNMAILTSQTYADMGNL